MAHELKNPAHRSALHGRVALWHRGAAQRGGKQIQNELMRLNRLITDVQRLRPTRSSRASRWDPSISRPSLRERHPDLQGSLATAAASRRSSRRPLRRFLSTDAAIGQVLTICRQRHLVLARRPRRDGLPAPRGRHRRAGGRGRGTRHPRGSRRDHLRSHTTVRHGGGARRTWPGLSISREIIRPRRRDLAANRRATAGPERRGARFVVRLPALGAPTTGYWRTPDIGSSA